MSFFAFAKDPGLRLARRKFLNQSGLVLSGTAVALMAGRDALAKTGGKATEDDVKILNTALGSELEAIAAYQVGAESGLLQKPVLDLAVTFQSHHKAHAQVLSSTIEKLGGKPVAAKAKYAFPVETLRASSATGRCTGRSCAMPWASSPFPARSWASAKRWLRGQTPNPPLGV
jgi:hypothetical protein